MEVTRLAKGSMADDLAPGRVSWSSDSVCHVRCLYHNISRAWKIRPLLHSRKFDARSYICKGGAASSRPVILVGHSYGGLVIKQMCLHAHRTESLHLSKEQMAGFLNCVKGIFFYGMPHHGMSSFLSPNGTHLKDASPLVDYVKLLCTQSARLHEDFDALRWSYKWSIAGVGESKPTRFTNTEAGSQNAVAVSSEMIVNEASARYGDFTVEREDHVSLCQPESRTSNTYIRLTAFIQRIDDNKVNRRRLPDNFQRVPKMAMSLHSQLFVQVQIILRTAPTVGLCGMGGIGKSTLAKLSFNELCAEFEYTCFVPGFMLKGDYKEIERGVYSSMYHHGQQVARSGENKEWKPTALRLKTLLFILDDIDNDRHVELLQYISSLNDCENSRYIVTSRDRDILNRSAACVYDVKLLNHKSSKELFMSYAFPYSTEPNSSLTQWVDKIVAKCDGLPLTLEVMGKYLLRKVSESIWRQCLVALDEADNVVGLNERLWAKLKVSYDRLGSQEKEIFLDVASFFSNSSWNLLEAKSSWRVLYGYEDLRWQTLVDMSLVYDVGEKKSIQMHEQLRSLGIKLASEWGTCGRCRTWIKKNVPSRFNSPNYDERIAEVQSYSSDPHPHSSSTGTETHIEEVMALRLEDSMPLTWRDICQMKKLQYLDSEKELMLDEEGGKLPENLVLLRWRGEVDSLHDLVDGGSASHLAVLDLKAPLTCLPTTIGEFRNLEVLKFHGGLFQGLPESFVQLPSLRHLTFSNCRRLRSLPEAFGRLSQLGFLELKFCRNLEALPDSIAQLPRLHTLFIEGRNKLQRLPEGVGTLFHRPRLLVAHVPKLPQYIEHTMHVINIGFSTPYIVPCQALLEFCRQNPIIPDIENFLEDEPDMHQFSKIPLIRPPSSMKAGKRIVRATWVENLELPFSSSPRQIEVQIIHNIRFRNHRDYHACH
ncbi:protein SERAC1 [Marchantia polymorpha subsp. ruderalis]